MGSKGRIIKVAAAIVAGVALVIFIIWLVQVVVINGTALFKNLGAMPIATPTPTEEEIWMPDVEAAKPVGDDNTTPVYRFNVPENSDFEGTEDGQASGVPVDDALEELINTTPEPSPTPEPDNEQFFEPDESALEEDF